MEKLKPTWKTDGKELPADYKPGSFEGQDAIDILIQETPMSVDMDPESPEKKTYGVPITAKLAVALIADLQTMIDPESGNDDLKDLLVRSSAITIDKNSLLKTISQPGCEGVRFYLCKKNVSLADGSKKSFASVVTVGVDADGKDLHYNFEKGKLSGGLVGADLINTSLVSEYGAPPPPPYNKTSAIGTFDDRYVLLQYALEQTVNIKNQTF